MIVFNRTRHTKLWEDIARRIEQGSPAYFPELKRTWSGWKADEEHPCNDCFACEAAIAFGRVSSPLNSTCPKTCPLIWEDPSGWKVPNCIYHSSLFQLGATIVYTREEKAAFARRIAHLPLSKPWTDALACYPAIVQVI